MSLGTLLFSLPILIGLWIGVVGLRKCKNTAWWLMAIGLPLATLSVTAWIFPYLHMPVSAYYASGALMTLGWLLFAIGFAMHGFQASRTQQRITELEAIAAAQSEELDRARLRG